MVVFDFDGVIVKSGNVENIWRWCAAKMKIKTPKIFFFCQEIIEFIFNKKPKPIKETIEIMKKLSKNCCFVGILTDRSLWSLKFSLSFNLSFDDFDFIQTRKSILDCFIEKQHSINSCSKTKPDSQTLKNLKEFAAKKKLNIKEILIIDDLAQAVELACAEGFSGLHVKHINYIRYIKNI